MNIQSPKLTIENHRLHGQGVDQFPSPNKGYQFGASQPDMIIFHYTAGGDAEQTVEWLCDTRAKASAHVVIARNGNIAQLVPFDTIAWHAGRSEYHRRAGLNRYSIGIELACAGELTKSGSVFVSWFGARYRRDEVVKLPHKHVNTPSYWHVYTEQQLQRCQELCAVLCERYGIKYMLGHDDVAPQRKRDPGPAFPLQQLKQLLLQKDRAAMCASTVADGHHWFGSITQDDTAVYSGPSINEPIVCSPLSVGELVEVCGERHGFYKVHVRVDGWVPSAQVHLSR